jgi:hypothetical protein
MKKQTIKAISLIQKRAEAIFYTSASDLEKILDVIALLLRLHAKSSTEAAILNPILLQLMARCMQTSLCLI